MNKEFNGIEITGKTLLHLNEPLYFDDDGYEHDSLEEARRESFDETETITIRRQNCYMKEYNELSKLEKNHIDDLFINFLRDRPQDYLFIIGATSGELLFFNNWVHFKQQLMFHTFSIVKK